ncbi:MAG TPA: hypothetical protein VNS58_09440 [Puia sp.]|nr:hypothetical protein [Puia sp.]
MRFISPGSLFGTALPLPLDKKAIQLGRKKLLAELELSAGDSIELHGVSFSRNEIIDYCENLLKDNVTTYYNAIEEDRVLLGFLEESVISGNDRFNTNPLYKEDPFIRWISPYFFSAFTSLADSCFRHSDDYGLSTILRNELLMTENDQEQSWTFIAKILTNNIALLDYYQNQKKGDGKDKIPLERVSPFMGSLYTGFIQLLPENRFGVLRDRYAVLIMQSCIYIFNNDKDNRPYAKTWMEDAETLALSEGVKTEIANKLVEMNKVIKKNNSKKIWRAIWVIMIIVRIISWGATDSGDTYHFQNAPLMIEQKDSNLMKLLKSGIDSANRDSAKKNKLYIPPHVKPARLPDTLFTNDKVNYRF